MALRFENNGEKQRTPAKKKKAKNIGFYAALVLCVGAVVLTAAARPKDSGRSPEPDAFSSADSGNIPESLTATEENSADLWYSQNTAVSSTDLQPDNQPDMTPDVQPAVQTTTPFSTAPARMPGTTAATTSAAVPASAPLRFGMPTDGSITSGFSGDELIYCATMCDWRVHNGIDISGESGGEVLACADGIVEGFVEDMLYGNTATVRHADDSVMYYCGLSDTQMVSAGLQVRAGDVIGYIGEVPCELEDGPHIHLTLMKDGQFIDPATLLAQ